MLSRRSEPPCFNSRRGRANAFCGPRHRVPQRCALEKGRPDGTNGGHTRPAPTIPGVKIRNGICLGQGGKAPTHENRQPCITARPEIHRFAGRARLDARRGLAAGPGVGIRVLCLGPASDGCPSAKESQDQLRHQPQADRPSLPAVRHRQQRQVSANVEHQPGRGERTRKRRSRGRG
jgi:hypothetical protein